MINLKTALKITNIGEKEIVHLRKKDQIFKHEYEALTKREIINKYDLKKTQVTEITSYFLCGDYEGFLFTIK